MEWSVYVRYHGAVGDQTHPGILRKQAQADNKGFFKSLEVVVIEARIDDVEEDRGRRRDSVEVVLDGGVFGQQLSRQIRVRDILVVRRECIALQTERTDPELASDIDLALDEKKGQQKRLNDNIIPSQLKRLTSKD